jgi:uncharacterized protein (TIGR03435 family)
MRYRKHYILCVLSCVALSVCAQPATSQRLFDVASVRKIEGACTPGPPLRATPGRVVLHCFNARQLIRTAYNPLTDYDHENTSVVGGPSWIDSVRYEIEAKADGATLTDMTGVMLLGLLGERFHLQTHKESRSTPVYVLTVGDSGPKLKPADTKACVMRDSSVFPPLPLPSGGPVEFCGRTSLNGKDGVSILNSYSVPLEAFAAALSSVAGRPIVVRAGITGKYDIHLEFARESLSSGPATLNGAPATPADPGDSGEVSIFTAIRKQLGLKLTASTAPLDVVVVDRIDEPAGN